MAITFIGGGNMAQALIGGVSARDERTAIGVVDPAPAQHAALRARFPRADVAAAAAESATLARSHLIVLAVKPQQMRDAVRPLLPFLGASRPVVLSIAAGIRLTDLQRWLGGYDQLVRAMPNTPALISRGIAGVYAAPSVDAAGRELAAGVLAAGGEVVWVNDEAMLDAVTGVSSSGAAYVFYFMEALQRAAGELGFPERDARKLAYATFSGAIALAQASDCTPAELRAQVTSKAGTTERALASMEADGVGAAIVKAVKAATERAHELGEMFGKEA